MLINWICLHLKECLIIALLLLLIGYELYRAWFTKDDDSDDDSDDL